MKELSANELKDLMFTMKDLVLIDVREDWEVKVANIDNSLHIPISDIQHRMDDFEANQPLACYYPDSGWVEQDPYEIWDSQSKTIREALKKATLKMKDISAVGITNQRETTIAWNRKTGEAIAPAINWQCRRTADFCEDLKNEDFDQVLRNRTGLVTDPYFSGTKNALDS